MRRAPPSGRRFSFKPEFGGGHVVMARSPSLRGIAVGVAAALLRITYGVAGSHGESADARLATRGWFLQELARNQRIPADTPEVALPSLRSAGLMVEASRLEQPLTESDVVEIGGLLGMTIRSSSPQAPMSTDRARNVLGLLRGELDRLWEPIVRTQDEGGD